jgi:hypothetical protein
VDLPVSRPAETDYPRVEHRPMGGCA